MAPPSVRSPSLPRTRPASSIPTLRLDAAIITASLRPTLPAAVTRRQPSALHVNADDELSILLHCAVFLGAVLIVNASSFPSAFFRIEPLTRSPGTNS